jgi:predicted adenine nucleotide alpha hydrolase (AANH) superfamily ATPase
MLVHICCSVDSHYFLKRLRDEFPEENLIGFFYDPNIHPYSEYKLRLLDVERSCRELEIPLIEGEYDFGNWLQAVSGLEDEPEKGKRCEVCFDNRLSETVKKAVELQESSFTTSLLISPLKSQQQLERIGKELEAESGVEFIFRDFRSGRGVEFQAKEVKENNLYRQDYCGCLFALNKQRDMQMRYKDELISSITNQVLPASIEERLDFHSKVSKSSEIVKENFLNFRLNFGKVSISKKVVPSYFLFYSHSERKKISGKVEKIVDDIAYLNRDSVKILSLESLKRFGKSFNSIFEISFTISEELEIRNKIEKNSHSLSPILILEKFPKSKVEIELESEIFVSSNSQLLL